MYWFGDGCFVFGVLVVCEIECCEELDEILEDCVWLVDCDEFFDLC